jgi:replicative DNA helicase
VSTPASNTLPGLGDASEFAAAALLGALLWRPERIRDVSGWLVAEDFGRPAHGVIYDAVLTYDERRSDPQAVTDGAEDEPAVALTSIARYLMDPSTHPEMHSYAADASSPLSAPALHTLLSLTPSGPGGRSEHVRYAQLVLEASIRRQVSAVGARIAQVARVIPARRSDDAAAGVQALTGQAAGRLAELQRYLIAAAGPSSAIATALAPARPGSTTTTAVAPVVAVVDNAVWSGTTAVPLEIPTVGELQRAEVALLGACAVNPSVRTAALESLEAGDFTREDAATTWSALRALAQRGDPIDIVLLAAETEVIGASAGQEPGLSAAQLLHNAQRYGDPANGHHVLDTVARASLGRHTAATATALQATALDRARRGPEVVSTARARVVALSAAAQRLSGATTMPPSPATLALSALTPPPARRGAPPAPRGPVEQSSTRMSAAPAIRASTVAEHTARHQRGL